LKVDQSLQSEEKTETEYEMSDYLDALKLIVN